MRRTTLATLTIFAATVPAIADIQIRVSTDPDATFSAETLHQTFTTPPSTINLTVDPTW